MLSDKVKNRITSLNQSNRDLLTQFLEKERLSPKSEEIYYHSLQGYEKAIHGSLSDTSPEIMNKWFNWVENESKYSQSTQYIYSTRIRRLLQFAFQQDGLDKRKSKIQTEEYFTDIPLDKIRKSSRKKNSMRDKLVSNTEFNLLMNAAKNARSQAVLAILYDSGLRLGELLSLRIRDLEFYERHALLRIIGKTGERTVPIVKSLTYLRAWLQVHPNTSPGSPLFAYMVKGELKTLQPVSVEAMFQYLSKKAGITRRIHPHMYRHTRLTELAKQGLGEYQMKAFAGWTSGSNMANVYIKLAGSSHVDPLLEIAGIEVDKTKAEIESPLEVIKCPRCGNDNPHSALYCYSCSFVLDEKLAIEYKERKDEEISELRQEIAEMRKQQDELMKLLYENLPRK